MNRGGYNPEVRVRGGRAAHTWRAGRGTGHGRGGGRTRRTGAPLRVGKGHHVVPALHFQTLFCFPLARALRHAICVFSSGRAARLRRSLSPSASPLCTASPFCACIALCCSSCKWFSHRTTPPLLLDVHVQLL